MKKVRLFFIALAVTMISFSGFNSCKQAPKEGEEQAQEEKTEDMREEAEELEEDTAAKEEEPE